LYHQYGIGKGAGAGNYFYNRATGEAERAATQYEYPQGSACFIQSVDDTMEGIMELAFASMDLIRAMAETGNPNSVSDAGVGALCARAGVLGAFMNVRINAAGYDDKVFVKDILARGAKIQEQTIRAEAEIMGIVDKKIGLA